MESKLYRWKATIISNHLEIFIYVNVVWSLLEFSTFITNYPWIGLGLLSRFFMSWVLIWAHRKKNANACKLWCLFEAVMVVIILTLGLCRIIKFSRLGVTLAILSFFVKLYGLCIVYYFALEVASDKQQGCKQMFSNSKPRSIPTTSSTEFDSGYENGHRVNDFICVHSSEPECEDKCPLNNIEEKCKCKAPIVMSGSEVQYSVICM